MAHYHLGLPFNRLEALQQMLGLPLPDATQWDLVEQVADVGYRVFEAAKFCAAQQPLVFQDDTGARVLSLLKDNQAAPPPARPKGRTLAVAEDEDRPGEGFFQQPLPTPRCQPIDAAAEIHRFKGDEHPTLQGQLQHYPLSMKRSITARGSIPSPGSMHSRSPSGRINSRQPGVDSRRCTGITTSGANSTNAAG